MKWIPVFVGFVLLCALTGSARAQSDVNIVPAAKPFGAWFALNATNGGEAIAAGTLVVSVSLKAACTNTVSIMVGGSTLNYVTSNATKSLTLDPCDGQDMDISNLADVFVDAGTTAGQIVEWVAVRKQ